MTKSSKQNELDVKKITRNEFNKTAQNDKLETKVT